MKYTIDFKHEADIHTFIPRDNTGKIEIVVPLNGSPVYYNVAQGGTIEENLAHRDVIVKYYDPTDNSPFGVALLRATEMYLSLTEEN